MGRFARSVVSVALAAAWPFLATLAASAGPQHAAPTTAGALPEQLFVATSNRIFVYDAGATTLRLTIAGGLTGVTQIAVGANGTRYAANFGTSPSYANGSVTEYAPGSTVPTLTRTAGAVSANGVAVDAFGDVFASSYYRNAVAAYRPGSVTPALMLTSGIASPGLLAIKGNALYVGEIGSGSSQTAQIVRFRPGSTSPDLKAVLSAPGPLPMNALTYGGPFSVAADGSIYAGGYVVANDRGFEEFVNLFAPGAPTPYASIIALLGNSADSAPYTAVDGSELYVSNVSGSAPTVTEWQVNGTGPMLVRRITAGLSSPGPLAVDAEHRLYVANATGTVQIYLPGATAPAATIAPPASAGPIVDLVVGP